MAVKFLVMVTALPALATTARWVAETIATDLDNPRGVAVAPDGTVYVAESGSGGSTENNDVEIDGQPGLFCSGLSGGITKIEFVNGTNATVGRIAATFDSFAGTCVNGY